jgi:archaellum component FlaC
MDERLQRIILDYKDLPNKDLEFALENLSSDFNHTKELLVKLTHHLDSLENNYNNILEEYKKRSN